MVVRNKNISLGKGWPWWKKAEEAAGNPRTVGMPVVGLSEKKNLRQKPKSNEQVIKNIKI